MTDQNNSFDAIIIGAGFSGLYQLHTLRDQLKLSTLTVESGSDLGGTWFWNRYPGARCDSESHTYMYYFSKDLVNEWEWSEQAASNNWSTFFLARSQGKSLGVDS